MATRRTVTKREAALMEARISGYHDDSGRFTRAVIERRGGPAMNRRTTP